MRRAAALLRAERSLWPWALVPLALNLAAFAVAASVFFASLDSLAAPVERFLAVPEPERWWGYLQAAPLRLLAALVKVVLIGAFGLALYFGFTVIGGVIAAPFLDVLSERVERLATGREPPNVHGVTAVLRRAARSALEEGKRVAFFLALQLAFVALGFVPGLQPFAALASLAASALFMPLDYTGFALDRRGVRFAARRRWLARHPLEMLSFGGFALVLYAVPGLSFVCLPWLVTAGTLLALEVGPPESAT
jgi:CysZ protein